MASVPIVSSVLLLTLVAIDAGIWDSKCDALLVREGGKNARIYIINNLLHSIHFGSKASHLLSTGHALADTERPRSCLSLKAQPRSSNCHYMYSALRLDCHSCPSLYNNTIPFLFPPNFRVQLLLLLLSQR